MNMQNVFIEEMEKSLLNRMGLPVGSVERFAHHSLPEMAIECVKLTGASPPSDNKRSVLVQALSTSDYPGLLAGTVNRVVLKKHSQIKATFEKITDIGRMPDFRNGSVVRMSHSGIFEKVGTGSQIKHLGQHEEGAEPAKIESYGGITSIDARAILDDDLNVLSDTGSFLARTGKRTQNAEIYRYLLSNPTMSDGVPLFHNDRGNLMGGAGSALDKTSLATAMKSLRLLGDDDGNPYGIEPTVLLVPPALEENGAELCRNIAAEGRDRLELVIEPLLESNYLQGGSSTAWYLLPDPKIVPVIRLLGIEGQGSAPYLGELAHFNSDTIEFKGLLDFGVVAVSPWAVKSAGQ